MLVLNAVRDSTTPGLVIGDGKGIEVTGLGPGDETTTRPEVMMGAGGGCDRFRANRDTRSSSFCMLVTSIC